MVGSGVVVILVVPSVRTVCVREWVRAPGFLFDARLPDFSFVEIFRVTSRTEHVRTLSRFC